MKLKNIRDYKRLINPETNRPCNVKKAEDDKGQEVFYYLLSGKQVRIAQRDLYQNWITPEKKKEHDKANNSKRQKDFINRMKTKGYSQVRIYAPKDEPELRMAIVRMANKMIEEFEAK